MMSWLGPVMDVGLLATLWSLVVAIKTRKNVPYAIGFPLIFIGFVLNDQFNQGKIAIWFYFAAIAMFCYSGVIMMMQRNRA